MINKIKKLYICYPSGNINAIVEDYIPKQDYFSVAEKIINLYNKDRLVNEQIEQVAFINKPINKKAFSSLSLSGGEFSGNAVLCLGALKLKNRQENKFQISGSKQLLRILADNNGNIIGQMPIYKFGGQLMYTMEKFPIIFLQGITQILIFKNFNKSRTWLKKISLRIIKNNKLEKSLAVAIVFIKRTDDVLKIKPFVYFKRGLRYEIVRETSCGSATTAVGIYLSIIKEKTINNQKIIQPSGDSLFISVKKFSNQFEPYLSGKVKIISQGSFNLIN